MAPIRLDDAIFYSPPAAKGTENASPSKQRHGHCSSPLLEPLALPTNKEHDYPSATVGQSLDQPIYVFPADESGGSDIDTIDAEQDDGDQSDSTLPSINTLVKKQGHTSIRGSLGSLFEEPESIDRPVSPTFDYSSQKADSDGEPSSQSSLSPSQVPSNPQADDATPSYEKRSKISSGSGESNESRGSASASGSRSETPQASSPTRASPSRPQRRGIGTETGMPRKSETTSPQPTVGTPHHGPSKLRRTSQRRVKKISAYANSDPDTTSTRDSDSDDDASAGGDYPPLSNDGGHDADDESDSPSPKRRKATQYLASFSRKRRREAPLLGVDISNARAGTSQSACDMPNPPSSRHSPPDSLDSTTGARFEEWALSNVVFKRVKRGDGRANFLLEFHWDPDMDNCPSSNRLRPSTSKKGGRPRRDAASGIPFTEAEDELLKSLKEGQGGLNWSTIYREFDRTFPGRRSKGGLQVHYSTKLKRRGVS